MFRCVAGDEQNLHRLGLVTPDFDLAALFRGLCQGCASTNHAIAQCSVYGLGVLAQHGGAQLDAYMPAAAHAALALCRAMPRTAGEGADPSGSSSVVASAAAAATAGGGGGGGGARSRSAVDNAVSALMKLLLFRPKIMASNNATSELAKEIVSNQMPLLSPAGDREEQQLANNRFVALLEAQLQPSKDSAIRALSTLVGQQPSATAAAAVAGALVPPPTARNGMGKAPGEICIRII